MDRKDIDNFARGAAPVIKQYVKEQLAPLERRLAELATRESNLKYVGTWQPSGEYRHGNFVSHDGSMWSATRDTRSRPGTSDDWQLCVKRGKDAREQ